MQICSKLTAGRAAPVWGVAARIRRRSTLLLGLGFLAWLHHPAQSPGATVAAQYGVALSWERSTSTAVSGYRVYYGTASGNYTNSLTVGNVTTNTVLGLTGGVPYFFAIRAYTVGGMESPFSAESRFVPGQAQMQIRRQPGRQFLLTISGLIGHSYEIQATQDFKTWQAIGTVTLGSTGATNFTDLNVPLFSRRYYRTREKI